jgi:glycine/D-amino acid oxidase-like deaminating enzyme
VEAPVEENGRVTGVRTSQNQHFHASHVVIAAGAWTPFLIPELSSVMKAVGQPVFHLKPADPDLFRPPRFFVFSADVSRTGYYGFPLHPREGVIKLARHGTGQPLHPSRDERTVPQAEIQTLRTFLSDSLPALAEAPLVDAHLCPYCDTLDEHFWIARHPEREGLTVAAGGSGHGFKFGPVLGQLIADAVEGKPNPHLQKFGWRDLGAETAGEEATRYRP